MTHHPHRILVVDDSPASLVVLKAIFEKLELPDVMYFSNSLQALEQLRQTPHRFDLVFTDLRMPDVDGMELIRELGKLHFQGAIVIVSEMDPKVIDLASELARQKHTHLIGNINKPIHLNEVKLILHKYSLMERHRNHSQVSLNKRQLLDAIGKKQIQVLYQPLIDSGKICAVEVIPVLECEGIAEPLTLDEFLPLAQSHNLLNMITFQLLEKAARDFVLIDEALGSEIRLCFNLHSSQLIDCSYPEKLNMLLTLNQLKANKITLEISEYKLFSSPSQLETINRLKIQGFNIALDDYGCGYVSLMQLRQLPLDEIKLSPLLTTDISEDNYNQTIISNLLREAEEHNIVLVAQDVCNEKEFSFLQQHFPTIHTQGAYHTRPRTLQEFLTWYKDWCQQ